MTDKKTPQQISPTPGYILTEPFIDETSKFPSREPQGEDQKSHVIAVGDNITDSEGVLRVPPCKVGDIIIHANSNKTFTINYDEFRFVHFVEVHGILNI